LVDLPNEILLAICRYIAPIDVLRAFFTPETPDARLHRVILIYRTHMNPSATTFAEYRYIVKLFNEPHYSLQPISLTINKERIPSVTKCYFSERVFGHKKSLCDHLRQLTLINCTPGDLGYIIKYLENLKRLEQLHVIGRKFEQDTSK
jgi:hypothetical protein